MNAIVEQCYRVTVEARIDVLLQRRKVDRRLATWTQGRKDREVELRALVRLARSARKLAASAPDPMDAYKSYHDWQIAGPVA